MASNLLESCEAQTVAIATEEKAKEKVVRICVLGATGVGKSTLCNFICNEDVFKAQDGPNTCTKQSSSFNFEYNIYGTQVKFEITDTPGWFDMNSGEAMSRCPSALIMIQKIKECIKISENGITAFFIVVPYQRLHIDIEKSIYFMRDCFDSSQLKHVWMIFTKCKKIKNIQQILETFKQEKDTGEKAATLLYNYSQTINQQCYATECEYGDEKELSLLRNEILNTMNSIYDQFGTVPEGVFQTAQRDYQRQVQTAQRDYQRQVQTVKKRYRNKNMMMGASGIVFASIIAAKGYMKYQSLFKDNITLKRQYNSTVAFNQELQNQYIAVVNDHDTLQNQYIAVVNDHDTLQNQHEAVVNDHETLQQNYRGYEIATGVAEITVGSLCFLFEPVTSSIAFFDGCRRITDSITNVKD